jgi:hypothetical protein
MAAGENTAKQKLLGKYPYMTSTENSDTISLPETQTWECGYLSIQGEASVEFRLIYRGPLHSNGNKDHKHAIRRCFHAQLKELWDQHSGLRALSDPNKNYRHKKEPQIRLLNKKDHRYDFLYLIGESHGLSCAMDVLFLRRESPGGLFAYRGDLDNRLKTLFDALKSPNETDEITDEAPREGETPFFCVLSDDKYIDRLTITTDRLLTPMIEGENKSDVFLVINVKTLVFDNSKADWWQLTDR